MKMLIASDIHGSAYYTRILTDIIRAEQPDLVALLGDIYNHGPRNPLPREYAPKEVAAMLNAIKDKLLVIKGNCDSEVDSMISEFPLVESAAVVLGQRRIWLTHGHVYSKDNPPPMAAGDVLVYGHFHKVMCQWTQGVGILNPGSISLPKDDNRAYIRLDENAAELVSITGEILDTLSFDEAK